MALHTSQTKSKSRNKDLSHYKQAKVRVEKRICCMFYILHMYYIYFIYIFQIFSKYRRSQINPILHQGLYHMITRDRITMGTSVVVRWGIKWYGATVTTGRHPGSSGSGLQSMLKLSRVRYSRAY